MPTARKLSPQMSHTTYILDLRLSFYHFEEKLGILINSPLPTPEKVRVLISIKQICVGLWRFSAFSAKPIMVDFEYMTKDNNMYNFQMGVEKKTTWQISMTDKFSFGSRSDCWSKSFQETETKIETFQNKILNISLSWWEITWFSVGKKTKGGSKRYRQKGTRQS